MRLWTLHDRHLLCFNALRTFHDRAFACNASSVAQRGKT